MKIQDPRVPLSQAIKRHLNNSHSCFRFLITDCHSRTVSELYLDKGYHLSLADWIGAVTGQRLHLWRADYPYHWRTV